MAFDFYKFLTACKKSEKSIYISDEVVQSQMARQRDDRTDRKRAFHRTTILHATPHHKPLHFTEPPLHITLLTKQTIIDVEEALLTQTRALLLPTVIFRRIPDVLIQPFELF